MAKDTKDPDSMKALFKALKSFQSQVPVIEKSKKVNQGKFSYNYAPLDKVVDTIQPFLDKNGLGFSQPLASYGGRPAIRTIIFHEDGGTIEQAIELPVNADANPQQYGSAITYFRRYGLESALGIVTSDDIDAQDQRSVSSDTKVKLWELIKADYASQNDGEVPNSHQVAEYVKQMTGKVPTRLYEEDAQALIKILQD